MSEDLDEAALDRSDSDRRQGSGRSRRKADDPAMTEMFKEYGCEDEGKGDRRTAADRRDEDNVKNLVENSQKSPGYIE